MLVSTPGILGSAGGGGFPPYGTLLSSVCSGPEAHDQGDGTYYDVNSNSFVGMFTLWEQLADGSGGSFWVNQGNNQQDVNVSCWLPQYFYFSTATDGAFVSWSGCGSSGNFEYGANISYGYWNGDGTQTTGGYFNDYGFASGTLIYDNGSGCCYVYYDGAGGYYVSDSCGGGGGGGGGCDAYGTWLGYGCVTVDGYDAAGNYWSGAWQYAELYADGNCGSYTVVIGSNTMGCYLPYGYWISYSSSPSTGEWIVNDSCGNYVANGNYTYANSWGGEQADGNGGTYAGGGSWQADSGYQFTSGSYSDCDGNYYNYQILSDGSSGYYINTSSV